MVQRAEVQPAPAGAVEATARLVLSLTLVYTGVAMTAVGATLLLVDRFGVGPQTGITLALQVVPSVLLAPLAQAS